MKNTLKISLLSLSIFMWLGMWLADFHPAQANVFIFPPTIMTATATSTLANIAPGVGTTTLLYDSYNTGQPFATENAVLMVLDTASSTSSVLKVALQYSQNGLDWYNDDINVVATSSLQTFNTYTYTAVSTTASTSGFAIPVLTPTRYVRVIFSSTGATNSIFAQITPRRQLSGQ